MLDDAQRIGAALHGYHCRHEPASIALRDAIEFLPQPTPITIHPPMSSFSFEMTELVSASSIGACRAARATTDTAGAAIFGTFVVSLCCKIHVFANLSVTSLENKLT